MTLGKITSMDFYDARIGDKIYTLNNVKNIDITKDVVEKIDKYGHVERVSDDTYINIVTDGFIQRNELFKILGVDESTFPDAYDVNIIIGARVRKHKKKRIDKKWCKRYGYKPVQACVKGWKLKYNSDDSCSLVKDESEVNV